jgi:hypothetical protein
MDDEFIRKWKEVIMACPGIRLARLKNDTETLTSKAQRQIYLYFSIGVNLAKICKRPKALPLQ